MPRERRTTHTDVRSGTTTTTTTAAAVTDVEVPGGAVGGQGLHAVHLATVSGQVARAGEPPAAHLAAVGPLPRVHPPVVAEAAGPREGRPALPALERLGAAVHAQVGVEARPLAVAQAAHLAAEGPLPVVVEEVLGQVVAEEEGLGAVGAGEAARGAVALEVHVQQLDRLAAQVADLPRAQAAVPVHLLLVLEGGAAGLADQGLQLGFPPLQPLQAGSGFSGSGFSCSVSSASARGIPCKGQESKIPD